ncbi:MAG: hypothetical protein ACFFB2_04660 [Promethearchaeota archaeon]
MGTCIDFKEEGFDKASRLVLSMMEAIGESEQADRFSLFDPIEELF